MLFKLAGVLGSGKDDMRGREPSRRLRALRARRGRRERRAHQIAGGVVEEYEIEEDANAPLSLHGAGRFCAAAARAKYLASGRPDLVLFFVFVSVCLSCFDDRERKNKYMG